MENFIELTHNAHGMIDINIDKIESYYDEHIITDIRVYAVKETKAEIRQKIKEAKELGYVTSGYLQTDNSTFVNNKITFSSDVINKPKRTIFDLTYAEFRNLMMIATDEWYDIVLSEDIKKQPTAIDYCQILEYKGSTLELKLRIFTSLDMALYQNDRLIIIDNQVQLQEKLNEMLNGVE